MDISYYYDKIMQEPLLEKEEEMDLFLQLQDLGISDDRKEKIRHRILRANLRFVFKEAKRYSRNDPSIFSDLISAGNEGLLVGLEKYNPDSGCRFLTYAGWWVKQRILGYMSSQRLVALPIWRQQLSSRIQKVIDSNEGVTLEELFKEFSDVPKKDVRELFQTRFLTFYIEDIGEDPAFEINPIENEVNLKLDLQKLHKLVESLPTPKRQILEMLFGLIDGEEHKPNEIMKVLNLSREQFKLLKKESLADLKENFDT